MYSDKGERESKNANIFTDVIEGLPVSWDMVRRREGKGSGWLSCLPPPNNIHKGRDSSQFAVIALNCPLREETAAAAANAMAASAFKSRAAKGMRLRGGYPFGGYACLVGHQSQII